ncbi:hypothetical protein D3C81_1472640 [compost metagenome]
MQLHHLGHKIQPQPGALAPAPWPRQRVEPLADPPDGIRRYRLPLVEQAQCHPLAVALQVKQQGATCGGEIQCVIQQVGQRLAHQERITQQAQTSRHPLTHVQTGAFDPRPMSQQQLVHQRRQRHLLFILQGLHLLDPGQV